MTTAGSTIAAQGRSGAFTLTTPEGVPLPMQLASVLERFTALVVDLLILVTVALVLMLGLGFLTGFVFELLAVLFLVMFLLRYGYFFFFEIHWRGTTPAKRMMRLRVISVDGAGLTVNAVLARNLMRDLEIVLPIVAVLAPEAIVGSSPWWLWIPALAWVVVLGLLPMVTARRMRAGDWIAGTVVIQEPPAPLLPDEAAQPEPNDRTLNFTPEQLAVYGEHELETLADILHKAAQGHAKPDQLRTIAGTIARRIGYQGQEPAAQPHRFLQAFYKQQRAELEQRLIYGKRYASKHDRQGGAPGRDQSNAAS